MFVCTRTIIIITIVACLLLHVVHHTCMRGVWIYAGPTCCRYWKSVKKIGRILSDVFVLTLSLLAIILIIDFVYALIGVRVFGGL